MQHLGSNLLAININSQNWTLTIEFAHNKFWVTKMRHSVQIDLVSNKYWVTKMGHSVKINLDHNKYWVIKMENSGLNLS